MIVLRNKLFSLRDECGDTVTINCNNGPLILKKYLPIKPVEWLGKLIKPIGDAQKNSLYYDVFLKSDNKKIGEVNVAETSPIEMTICWIGINKEYRGNHYATEILKYFINIARSKKYRIVTIEWDGHDRSAIHIYKNLGFIENPEESEYGLTIMHKSL